MKSRLLKDEYTVNFHTISSLSKRLTSSPTYPLKLYAKLSDTTMEEPIKAMTVKGVSTTPDPVAGETSLV